MLIRMNEVVKDYSIGQRKLRVLNHIQLEIPAGAFFSIMGKSGSGKSTLLYLLGCMDLPTSGSYELNGIQVSDFDDRELSGVRNRHIGFVFQTFNLIPSLNVLENVEIPLYYSGVPKKDRKDRCLTMIRRVGLEKRVNHKPNQLSGGEMQRVAIARSLVNDPPLILADEPTGNLDSQTSKEIMGLLSDLNRQGKTLVMVTHDPSVAAYGQRTIHIKDGKIENPGR